MSLAFLPDKMKRPRTPRPPEPRIVAAHPARQPLPRQLAGRIRIAAAYCRKLPLLPIGIVWVLFLGIGVSRYIANAPYFQIGDVALAGTSRLDSDKVLGHLQDKTGACVGASLIQLDGDSVHETLAAIPEVREASVEKVWPNELRLWVVEREAAGILVSERGSFVFDRDGFVFSKASPKDFLKKDFLVLSGFKQAAPEPGRTLPTEAFHRINHYAKCFAKAAPSLKQQISEWHWDDEEGLTVVMDNGARIRCGERAPEDTGPVIESLLTLQEGKRRIQSATLVTSNHVAVRWIGETNQTTVTQAVPKQ